MKNLNNIFNYSKRACSVYNIQPWIIEPISQDSFYIVADHNKSLLIDNKNRELMIALGTFLEATVLAGAALGYNLSHEIIAQTPFDTRVIKVNVEKTEPSNIHILELIEKRRTIRNGLLSTELDANDLSLLMLGFEDNMLFYPISSTEAKDLHILSSQAFAKQIESLELWKETYKWTHMTEDAVNQAKAGIPYSDLNSNRFITKIMHYFNQSSIKTSTRYKNYTIKLISKQLYQGCGWLIITTPDDDIESWIDTGRKFYRLAIGTSSENIGLLPVNHSMRLQYFRELVKNMTNNLYPQIVMRVGYVADYGDATSPRNNVNIVQSFGKLFK